MKKPNVPLSTALGRAAAELTIIVVGVLIALGAQSWWESRQEDEERDQAEAAIRSDLRALQTRTTGRKVRVDSLFADLAYALSDSSAVDTGDALVRAQRLRNAFFDIQEMDGSLPAWEDLLNSGRSDLLPYNGRLGLAAIEATLSDARREGDTQVQLQTREIEPYLIRSLDIDRIFELSERMFDGTVAPEEIGDGGFPDDFLRRMETRNHLAMKQAIVYWTGEFAAPVWIRAELTLMALDGAPLERMNSDSVSTRLYDEFKTRVDSVQGVRAAR